VQLFLKVTSGRLPLYFGSSCLIGMLGCYGL
jgi:hypothetical protein